MQVIEADLTYIDGRFLPGIRVSIDAAGRIVSAGPGGPSPSRHLHKRALLPGFVNVHSHAFQRALRGIGEAFPAGVNDFWTWREGMYALVQRLDRARLQRVCRLAFEEMLSSGITCVGEFHYVHHERSEAADFIFDEIVLQAAAETGIRIVLLECYYRTGGIGQPLAGGQQRFSTQSVDALLARVDWLGRQLEPRSQSVAIAPHSIRAVPPDDLKLLRRAARDRGLVCHMHVEEQRREVEECRAALGRTPMGWILDNLEPAGDFTIIHGTHTDPAELDRYIASGANVCICPISEANLGDGVADLPRMLRRPQAVCIGSDSNIRIDFCEELRWLEYVQRLKHERRGLLKTADGQVARLLMDCGTRNGAAALGLAAGAIEAGRAADLVAIDLDEQTLAGWTTESLLDAFVFGSGPQAVREVCVAGEWVRS